MVRRHAVRLTVIVGVAAVAAFTALVVSASYPSDAAYPGANGRIAYGYGESYGYGGGAIWSADADGSSPVTLADSGSDRSPAYSANGSRIAFERGNGIAVMNADGSGVAQLLEGASSTSSETKFETEYETSENPPRIIPVVRIHTVNGSWHHFGSPSFSPDGSQLAIEEAVESRKFTVICSVEVEGEESCPEYEYGSEDSFFDYEYECEPCISRIVTVDATSGARTWTVVAASGGEYSRPGYYQPTYSVDGRIAFARWTPKGSSLFVVDSPGATPRQVASGYFWLSEPDFSPDGSKIAFGRGGEIATVSVAGGPLTILPTPIPPDAYSDYADAPAFSPDGTKIAFERTIFFSGKWDYGIDTMATGGSGLAKVIDQSSGPSWQPLAQPAPPAIPPEAKARKGKVRLDRQNRALVGKVICGSSPCSLKIRSAKLRAGKKRCGIEARVARRLAAGKGAKVRIRVAGKCLAALKRAGRGRLIVKIRAADALGGHPLKLGATLVPYKGHKHKRR